MKKTLVSLIFVLLAGALTSLGQTPESSAGGRARSTGQAQLTVGASSINLPAPQEAVQLRVLVGKSVVVNSREFLKRVSVSDPTIASAVSISPTQVLLNGLAPGKATLLLWNEQEQPIAYDLQVELDVVGLRDTMARVFPNENIQISQSGASIVLTGSASTKEVADRATAVAQTQSKNVVSLLAVLLGTSEGQVLLQVRFAEVDRTAVQQLGINIFSTGLANTPGTVTTGQFSPPSANQVNSAIPGRLEGFGTMFTLSDLLNIFVFRPDLNLGVTIRALQQRNVLQILADPTCWR